MRIGYLDDEYDILKSAMRSLKKYDIEIVTLKILMMLRISLC